MGCGCGGRSFSSTGVGRRSTPSTATIAQNRSNTRPPSPMRAPTTAPAHIVQSQVLKLRQNVRRSV